jgi:hypothetical protein
MIFVILALGRVNERWIWTNFVKVWYGRQYVYTGVINGLVLLWQTGDFLGCSSAVGISRELRS